MKAMILAAGRGKRMGSLTQNIPKPLTKISDFTIIEHNILKLKEAGITNLVINISWLGNKIRQYLDNGSNLGVSITYLDESENMLGTGGGILNALPHLGDRPFWLVNADVYSDFKINPSTKLRKGDLGHLILVPNPPHNSSGDFSLKDSRIIYPDNGRTLTFSGMSLISPKLFSFCNERIFPLEPLLENFAKEDRLSGEINKDFWMDVGTQERLGDLKRELTNRINR